MGVNGQVLVKRVYEKITDNWDQLESRGKKNWRCEPKTKSNKWNENESKEVILERLIVLTAGDDWTNQVPTCSGLTKAVKPRQSFDKRRAIDLAHRFEESWYEFIELKVGSNTPLYAAMEILQYGLLYVFYRENLTTLEPEKLTKQKKELLGAKGIHLRVLAPESFYYYEKDGRKYKYNLKPLERAINDGLTASPDARKHGMDFEFQAFPSIFDPRSLPHDPAVSSSIIMCALGGRTPVYSHSSNIL